MMVLGLSFDYHDSAAALVIDGKVIAAAQEERFSRKKHDAAFPALAIEFVLKQARARPCDINSVVFYENTLLKFDRIVRASAAHFPASENYIRSVLKTWCRVDKFNPLLRISEKLGIPLERIHAIDHHLAHAAAAYYCSPLKQATVITLDGVGEYETMTVSSAINKSINKQYAAQFPHSLGLVYSAFTAFLGFEVNEGEYKVMGMAGFGRPVHADKVRKMIECLPDGTFKIHERYFNFMCPETVPYTKEFVELMGSPRLFDSAFDPGDPTSPIVSDLQESSRHYADVAASIQCVTEEVIFHIVDKAVDRTGINDVCLAGGVGLNSVANGKLCCRLKGSLYVQPAAGDAGGALGAALSGYFKKAGERALESGLDDIYLGASYSEKNTLEALEKAQVATWKRYENEGEMLREVAQKLHEGSVVGWHQGRFEWGPRSLGARSILANPTLPEMQMIVNEKIKFRESFRPFAPSVLAEKASEYFELPKIASECAPEYFMLSVARVRKNKQRIVPSITHADKTARVHLVSKKTCPMYYHLIEEFGVLSGVPMLLNTSFNRRGEPIVASPFDALRTFLWSGMDYVVIGNILVWKEPTRWGA